MKKHSITLEVNTYENDWWLLLNTERLKKIIYNCNYDFDERILYINNVKNRDRTYNAAKKYLKNKLLTSIIFVEDIADEVIDYFEIKNIKNGYYYTIQYLAGIYNCKTDYLLHLIADSIIVDKANWIDDAISYFEKDNTIFVANPSWDIKNIEPKKEAISEDDLFYKGFGFSDQCYLIRTKDFKKKIYNESNIMSERYPKYAGESFEKRVDAYMRNHNLYRITSKKVHYVHHNYPKDFLRKCFMFLTGINLKRR